MFRSFSSVLVCASCLVKVCGRSRGTKGSEMKWQFCYKSENKMVPSGTEVSQRGQQRLRGGES